MISRYKDESLNIIFEYEDGIIPDGYNAKMKLIGKDIVIEKTLDISEDGTYFSLTIGTDEMQNLSGNYDLIVTLYNEDTNFGQRILNTVLEVKE